MLPARYLRLVCAAGGIDYFYFICFSLGYFSDNRNRPLDGLPYRFHCFFGSGEQELIVLAASDRQGGGCPCPTALASALITDRSMVPAATLERLQPIVGKYFEP